MTAQNQEYQNIKILPLCLDALSYQVNGTVLLNAISLRLEDGPVTAIIGPNGAGKSLLLRLCHGLLAPSTGKLLWQGAQNQNLTPQKLIREQAFLFQKPQVLNRNVYDNVDYPLKLRGINPDIRRERVEDVLRLTQLAPLAARFAPLLSGGEQQRLAFARAMITKPQVIFMDEPTASLDPKNTHEIEVLIKKAQQMGTKIILTSHDFNQVHRLADDVIFLHQGAVVEQGKAAQILTNPQNEQTKAFLSGELLF